MTDRVEKARELFLSGFSCAQSMFIAFSDIFSMTDDNARRLAAGLGGGIGRMRETCGVITSGSLILSLVYGPTQGEDRDSKAKTYEKVRELMERMKELEGTVCCRELLGLDEAEESCVPQERTQQYYEDRPCERLVVECATVLCQMLREEGIDV